jgi:hypothetical protein
MGGNRVQVVLRVLSRAGRLCGALAILALLVAGPAAAQATPTAPPGSPSVKYFVVPHADNPDDVTLFKIAERALGDGKRFPEIFKLNKGRPRPDGTPFNDAAAIQPGQVLQLPDDAVDPGVKFGPLPTVPPPPAPPAPPKATSPVPAPETSSLTVGLASVVSGAGGVVVGLLGGLWWRRLPRVVPPPAFEPVEDNDFESHSGTLPIPVVLPRPRDSLPELLRQEPITDGHSFIFLDTADTQVIAAIRPGSRFHFTLGKGGVPDVVDTIAGNSTTLVVDGESNGNGDLEGEREGN